MELIRTYLTIQAAISLGMDDCDHLPLILPMMKHPKSWMLG
jgi:hypothetical protein